MKEQNKNNNSFLVFTGLVLLVTGTLVALSLKSFDSILIGVCMLFVGMILIIISVGDMEKTNNYKKHPEGYSLCKRCGRIINKDKSFCNDCKYEIKRSLKHSDNTKYFNEYKKMVDKEKKK